jgi:5-methylcytosine-specific restriction endonuclease McrA
MPTARVCACGRITTRTRCPDCEQKRNQQPTRRAHHTPLHKRIRATVIRRDRACVDCGTTRDLTLDYVVPLSRGGQQTIDNAVTRCRSCNSAKGARGFLSARARNPQPAQFVFPAEATGNREEGPSVG